MDVLRSPFGPEELAEHGPLVFVDTDDMVANHGDVDTIATCPVVVAGAGPSDLVDVVVDESSLADVAGTVEQWPVASVALAMLLRGADRRSIVDGLVAESAVYSALQAGAEFSEWRAARPVRERAAEEGPAVRMERDGDRLLVTLSRPEVHNAFSARMRDELVDALAVAQGDVSIAHVLLAGEGPSFCSGGDLDEFGSRPDPATAHVIRLERSPARAMATVGRRVEAHLHGACMGAGIELAAFARRVVAAPDAVIGLPEVTLGLVPGAGGTVSLPRRIGRHRTALLALSGKNVDAATALEWGLVDEVQADPAS
jgi:enoyl-CoA hydratase/carnithine racemase